MQHTSNKYIIDQIIIAAFSYEATGQKDEDLKYEFSKNLRLLQLKTGTDREGAMQIVLNSQKESAA